MNDLKNKTAQTFTIFQLASCSVAAFTTGIAAYQGILQIAQLETVSKSKLSSLEFTANDLNDKILELKKKIANCKKKSEHIEDQLSNTLSELELSKSRINELDQEASKKQSIADSSDLQSKKLLEEQKREIQKLQKELENMAQQISTQKILHEEKLPERERVNEPVIDATRDIHVSQKTSSNVIKEHTKDLGRIQARLKFIQVLNDNSVLVKMKLYNLTDKELLIAFDVENIGFRPKDPDNIYLTDNLGNRYSFKSSSSMGRAHFINIKKGKEGWLTCPKNGATSLSITFVPKKEIKNIGSKFSTSIPIFVGSFYIDKYNYSRVGEETTHNIDFQDIAPK